MGQNTKENGAKASFDAFFICFYLSIQFHAEVSGKTHGMGVYTLSRGKGSYEGEWRNGKAHGVGKFTGPTGEEVCEVAPNFYCSFLDVCVSNRISLG
jgi:hypothetical protein